MAPALPERAGFSIIELLVVLAIIVALAAVAAVGFASWRDRLVLREAADSLVFYLEESKARAVAGTGGLPQGVYFAETEYVQFQGAAYQAGAVTNVAHSLDARLRMTTDILDGSDALVFSRMNGRVGQAVRITLQSAADSSQARVIVVGAGGDISIDR